MLDAQLFSTVVTAAVLAMRKASLTLQVGGRPVRTLSTKLDGSRVEVSST